MYIFSLTISFIFSVVSCSVFTKNLNRSARMRFMEDIMSFLRGAGKSPSVLVDSSARNKSVRSTVNSCEGWKKFGNIRRHDKRTCVNVYIWVRCHHMAFFVDHNQSFFVGCMSGMPYPFLGHFTECFDDIRPVLWPFSLHDFNSEFCNCIFYIGWFFWKQTVALQRNNYKVGRLAQLVG